MLFIYIVFYYLFKNRTRRTSSIGKSIGKFFRSLVLPYSSYDEPDGAKILAYSRSYVELTDILNAETFGSSESLVTTELQEKLSGKYGGSLKVITVPLFSVTIHQLSTF